METTLLAAEVPAAVVVTDIGKVAFIGSYLPRKCGIATFTNDLYRSVATTFPDTGCSVLSLNDTPGGYEYDSSVRFEIEQHDLTSYQRAADYLNLDGVDAVCIQHEYGIFGGPAGSHILALMADVSAPIVTTLHTVLENPDFEQNRVMREILELSSRVVVMTEYTRELLLKTYEAPASKVDLIAHGIPDIAFADPNRRKRRLNLEGRTVLLTFGLLSPGKGIEYAMRAVADVVADCPDLVYVVLGATHPHLIRDQGEDYRLSLERLAQDLGIERNVIFYDRFVELAELTEFISAADIYVTPYLNVAQGVSGTLAYAFGCGKPVISTPYWHARELLADDRGILVPFADSEAITRALRELVLDENRRTQMGQRAYELSRSFVWSEVARKYMESFAGAVQDNNRSRRAALVPPTLEKRSSKLPQFKLDHLQRMTDSTGLFQHAIFTVPNFSHGYCTDDNARGLLLTCHLGELGISPQVTEALRSTYLAFLYHALNDGRYRNFMSFERTWLEEIGSEDSHGRALWALGTCVGRSPQGSRDTLPNLLFNQALGAVGKFTSLRSQAFTLLGIQEYLSRLSGDRVVTQIQETLAGNLMVGFERFSSPDWTWFEDFLSYDNARLSQALIATGRQMQNPEMVRIGLYSLEWLMLQQTEGRRLRPIGSNFLYRRGGEKPVFDQQPLEAWAAVAACLEAFRTTSNVVWHERALRAFEWYLGRNDLGLPLYDSATGGCRDGLHPDRSNQNQGAESSLSFLLALAELRLVQDALTTFRIQAVKPILAKPNGV